jgi:tetratricopeptide (TPR) repeat protein
LQKARYELQKELDDKDYRMAAFRGLDVAHIYHILGDKKKANHYYRAALNYLDSADFQPLWIRLECLSALGKHEEALKIVLDDPHYTQLGRATLFEKAGNHDIAQKIYTELAIEHAKKAIKSEFLQPLFLQHAADLWERAHNIKEARKYNQMARKAWEKMKDNMESLHTIEKAWLNEEVGYIYEKAGKFETAMNYYEKAQANYEQAYAEDVTSAGAHYVDGDWDYYIPCFYLQLPEIRMIELSFEYFIKFDFKRIKYRILNLKEQMKKEY